MSLSREVASLDNEEEEFFKDTRTNNLSHGCSIDADQSALQLAFLDFLNAAQFFMIDCMPITWQPGLEPVGIGATATIFQRHVNKETAYTFKRINVEKLSRNDYLSALRVLRSELETLGNRQIRACMNIAHLIGICWDFRGSEVWPVLVFEKSTYGDLKRFMQSGEGQKLDTHSRLKLCADVAAAVMTAHAMCELI